MTICVDDIVSGAALCAGGGLGAISVEDVDGTCDDSGGAAFGAGMLMSGAALVSGGGEVLVCG
jgi:hypothetical protein